MTLPDSEEIMMPQNKQEKKIAHLLKVVLKKARDDNRITSGVFDCASRLELEPETVMLCLLPQIPPNDIATSIQHKLIEAHCMEHDIHVIQVDSCNKLSDIINKDESSQKSVNQNPVTTATMDSSCILIRYPDKGKMNKFENRLKTQIWPNQYVQLPI